MRVQQVDQQIYRFADFEADLARGLLSRAGEPLALRRKSFDVLGLLLRHAGSVVAQDRIIESIWRGGIASDESVARCISDIRKSLDDREARIVRTVPGRGYLMAVPVTLRPAVAEGRPELPARPSIVVLPFQCLGTSAEYFGDGLAEDLASRLSKFGELFVIARDSAYRFRHDEAPHDEVAARLGVRYVVGGTVRVDGQSLRIQLHLTDALTRARLWGAGFDCDTADVFAVQDDIAQRVVLSLLRHIGTAELARALSKPADTWQAYDHYLRGRHALAQVDGSPAGRYGERLLAAREALTEAVHADETYAPSLTGLADTYLRAWLVPCRGSPLGAEYQQPANLDRAVDYAGRAVERDPTLASAHAQLAWVLHWLRRRTEALLTFERALVLDPNLAEGRYAMALAHAGRLDEALAQMDRVRRLDPFHRPIYFSYLTNIHYLSGDLPKALEYGRLCAGLMPDVVQTWVWLAAAASRSGEHDEAQAACRRLLELNPAFSVGRFLAHVGLARAQDEAALRQGLLAAGLPAGLPA